MKRYGGPSEMNGICGSHNLARKFTVLPEKKITNVDICYELRLSRLMRVPNESPKLELSN